jgi:uncharacterized protein (DUF2062 family)
MDHDGFMTGMLWGGALVAMVPTLLVIGVGVYALRQHRAERRRSEAAAARAEEDPQ